MITLSAGMDYRVDINLANSYIIDTFRIQVDMVFQHAEKSGEKVLISRVLVGPVPPELEDQCSDILQEMVDKYVNVQFQEMNIPRLDALASGLGTFINGLTSKMKTAST